MSKGLENYHPLRAMLLWCLLALAVYAVLRRYGYAPPEVPGEGGYLSGIWARFWTSYLYGMIGAAFLGCTIFAIALFFGQGSGAAAAFARRLCGLPADLDPDDPVFHLKGFDVAIAPLRDAAALFPGLGFLGTVIGISGAIGGLREVMSGGDPTELIGGLRTAFDTTFLGLVAALLLTLINMSLTQRAIRIRSRRMGVDSFV